MSPQTANNHVPAVHAADVSFWDFKNVSPGASGAAAWNETKAAAAAENAAKHPSVDPFYVAEQILELCPKLAPLRDPALRRLSEIEAVEVARHFDSLPRLAQSLAFVCAQVGLEPSKDLSFKDLVADAMGLQGRGLVSCELLEKLGHVAAGTTKAIRKGRGHSDLAEDLQALHQVLLPNQARLAALQNFAAPNTPAISEADCARLSHVGTVLHLRLTQPGASGPWYTALVNLLSLTARAYDTAICAVHYHLRREGQRRPEREFVSFLGLRRPNAPKPAEPTPTPAP